MSTLEKIAAVLAIRIIFDRRKKYYPVDKREWRDEFIDFKVYLFNDRCVSIVVPAKAATQCSAALAPELWIPAFADMTNPNGSKRQI